MIFVLRNAVVTAWLCCAALPSAAQDLAFRPVAPPAQQEFDLISSNAGRQLSGESAPSLQRLASLYVDRSAELCGATDQGVISGWAAEVREVRDHGEVVDLKLSVGRTSLLEARFAIEEDLAAIVARLAPGDWIEFSGEFLAGRLFCLSQQGPLTAASLLTPVFTATVTTVEVGANYAAR